MCVPGPWMKAYAERAKAAAQEPMYGPPKPRRWQWRCANPECAVGWRGTLDDNTCWACNGPGHSLHQVSAYPG